MDVKKRGLKNEKKLRERNKWTNMIKKLYRKKEQVFSASSDATYLAFWEPFDGRLEKTLRNFLSIGYIEVYGIDLFLSLLASCYFFRNGWVFPSILPIHCNGFKGKKFSIHTDQCAYIRPSPNLQSLPLLLFVQCLLFNPTRPWPSGKREVKKGLPNHTWENRVREHWHKLTWIYVCENSAIKQRKN